MLGRKSVVAATLGVAVVAGSLFSTSAWAHDTSWSITACGSSGNTRCGYGGVTNSHTRVYSCDTYADGYGFRTYYDLRNGASGYVDDANGSSSGCSAIIPGSASNPIVTFQVVQKNANGWLWGPLVNA